MEKEVFASFRQRVDKAIEGLRQDFAKVRTGRASLALLDDIRVPYYGSPVPLNQVATLAVPESRLITIAPWDVKMLGEIERAILKSELSLTPTNDGKVIRIAIPALTEERRKELVKVLKKMAEECRVHVRNCRRDANEGLKKLERDKKLSEDDLHKHEKRVQEETDKAIARVDELLKAKEEEVLKF